MRWDLAEERQSSVLPVYGRGVPVGVAEGAVWTFRSKP
jgi:hypothetical protein